MDITLTTPALLFPAVTFLLVAYTNRFLAIGSRIRNLNEKYKSTEEDVLLHQIISLRRRVILIKYMQAFGVAGLFFCVLCMFVLFAGGVLIGKIVFGISLVFILTSLGISLKEIGLSVDALNLELIDLERKKGLAHKKKGNK